MYNSVNLADMRQKLITETLTLGGTFYKTRYIDKFDYRNKDKDWGNSKDSIQRCMQKLGGGYPADEPFTEGL